MICFANSCGASYLTHGVISLTLHACAQAARVVLYGKILHQKCRATCFPAWICTATVIRGTTFRLHASVKKCPDFQVFPLVGLNKKPEIGWHSSCFGLPEFAAMNG
jgi:hypothetical protein